MTLASLLHALQITHAPYWVAGFAVALLVRRVRRDLDAIARALRERTTEP